MLKIAICDDNTNTVRQCDSLIRDIAEKHQINLETFCFQSGESLLFEYSEETKQVDIIYLDIMMDHINGMEAARKLRECGCEAQIVFLTSCEDYVFEAFYVNAVHYLIKEDTSLTKFEKVFLQVIKRASEKKDEHFIYEFN